MPDESGLWAMLRHERVLILGAACIVVGPIAAALVVLAAQSCG